MKYYKVTTTIVGYIEASSESKAMEILLNVEGDLGGSTEIEEVPEGWWKDHEKEYWLRETK